MKRPSRIETTICVGRPGRSYVVTAGVCMGKETLYGTHVTKCTVRIYRTGSSKESCGSCDKDNNQTATIALLIYKLVLHPPIKWRRLHKGERDK